MTKKLKLPSVIRENKFNKDGFVETESGILVPAYVGSQFGFSVPGRKYLDEYFYPELKKRNVLPLCPFAACREYLDLSKLNDDMSVGELKSFWSDFNDLIGRVNYEILMPHSKFMIALLDGSHSCDDGLCGEIGRFTSNHGPVIGIRSDFRLSENIAASINQAVEYLITTKPGPGGFFFEGPQAYENALDGIMVLAQHLQKYETWKK